MAIEWESLCRRTNDPKLAFIEAWLDNLGVPHRRNGKSYHAPILEVPAEHLEFCDEQILKAPDLDYGIFDDRPDDDAMFQIERITMTTDGSHRETSDISEHEMAAHFENLNRELRDGLGPRWLAYAKLRNRAARLARFTEINAPHVLVEREIELVKDALTEINPDWRNIG